VAAPLATLARSLRKKIDDANLRNPGASCDVVDLIVGGPACDYRRSRSVLALFFDAARQGEIRGSYDNHLPARRARNFSALSPNARRRQHAAAGATMEGSLKAHGRSMTRSAGSHVYLASGAARIIGDVELAAEPAG
jgi:hypothetical protein